jgi:hypothetical protein
MVSSELESEWSLASASAIFAEAEALLDECLPDAFPEDGAPDLKLGLDAFSSCSCLSMRQSETLCPLRLQ